MIELFLSLLLWVLFTPNLYYHLLNLSFTILKICHLSESLDTLILTSANTGKHSNSNELLLVKISIVPPTDRLMKETERFIC